MVARINTGKTIKGALNYNEVKVREGTAECIGSHGLVLDLQDMTFHDKLRAFTDLIARNQRSKTNVVHVSLNFHPGERLDREKLCEIADTYMKGIGFQNQPYLVYQHFDAAHPHIHILTTSIQHNGKRIRLHNLGRIQSEATRRTIEERFNLVKATKEQTSRKANTILPLDIEKGVYGKTETKRSISNIVRGVVGSYRYTSLAELNAALRQYNVVADRGREGTMMFDKKGLLYSLLDKDGNKVGVPIKASSIYSKPTLPFIEGKFSKNEIRRAPHRQPLAQLIESQFQNGARPTKEQFEENLRSKGIYTLFRVNNEGRTYGITFVDNNTKCVFNGSSLTKALTANRILEKLSTGPATTHFRPGFISQPSAPVSKNNKGIPAAHDTVLGELFHAELPYNPSPEDLLRLKRRKRNSIPR